MCLCKQTESTIFEFKFDLVPLHMNHNSYAGFQVEEVLYVVSPNNRSRQKLPWWMKELRHATIIKVPVQSKMRVLYFIWKWFEQSLLDSDFNVCMKGSETSQQLWSSTQLTYDDAETWSHQVTNTDNIILFHSSRRLLGASSVEMNNLHYLLHILH